MARKLERAGKTAARALIVATVAIVAALMAAVPAWADTVQFENGGTATVYENGTIVGSCSTTVYFVPYSDDDVDHFDVHMPDGQMVWGDCIDYGKVAPVNGSYTFFATPVGGDVYSVVVDSGGSGYGVSIDGSTVYANSRQRVGEITWRPRIIRHGSIEVRKSSALPDVTNGNACYSIEGAEYGVYKDEACTDKVTEIVTDENGRGKVEELDLGTYYVKETQAPMGYKLDGQAHQVTLGSGGSASIDVVLELEDQPAGDPDIMGVGKVDAATTANLPEGSASLENAEFTFRYYAVDTSADYNESNLPAQPTRTWVMKTRLNNGVYFASPWDGVSMRASGDDFYYGSSGKPIIPLGVITAIETKAPEGYLLGTPKLYISKIVADETQHSGSRIVPVNYDDTGLINIEYNTPIAPERVKRGNVSLTKRDSETANGAAQGDATLAGAVYDVVNASDNAVVSPQWGTTVAKGGVVCRIVTDASGFASTTRADLNGWSIPEEWEGKALAYGDYTVVESGASEGYNLNASWRGSVTIENDGQLVRLSTVEDVMRGSIKVGKVSRESMSYAEQGDASLDGWAFEIVNRSAAAVMVGGTLYGPGEVVDTIETEAVDGRHIAQTAERALPEGTYEVREVKTMRPDENGYMYDEESRAWSHTVMVASDGQVIDLTSERDAAPNRVVRGDVAFTKVDYPYMRRMAGIPFKVTSLTTGEWHVVVTDENGQVDTSADFNPHTEFTNANDAAIGAGDAVDETKLDPKAGVWFSGYADRATAPDDRYGALPHDSYRFEELSVAANEKFTKVSFEVTVTRDGRVLDAGTVSDTREALPLVGTTLQDNEGGKVVAAKEHAVLVDAVQHNNLESGQSYTLESALYVVENGQVGAELARETTEFTPTLPHSVKEVQFNVDTTGLEGKSLVCFEWLYDSGGELIASHEDPADEGQTVSVPRIATTLVDKPTGGKTASVEGECAYELVDTIAYSGLAKDKTYTVTGTLHDKSTGKAIVDSAGQPVQASKTFTPAEESGTVDVTFSFNCPDAAGKTIVAFESVEYRGVEYAVHADIEDEAQAVHVPSIGTTAIDKSTGTHVGAAGMISIVDTVAYENLVPGVEYEVSGELHWRDGTGTDTGAVSDKKGDPVKATVKLTPEQASGTVDVEFSVDAGELAGKTVVAFEKASFDGAVVARHEDVSDEAQAVHYPEIGTTANIAGTDAHISPAAGKLQVTDTIAYENLVPGVEYTAKGTLHVRGADGKDEGELLDESGKPVTASAAFTPEKASGTVQVAFEADVAGTAGKALVAFESIEASGVVVARHADIADEGQTVRYAGALHTSASSQTTGTQALAVEKNATVVDVVSYENLVPGETYVLTTTLHARADDGSDAGAYAIEKDSDPITAKMRFTPEKPDGQVAASMVIDTREIAGKALVAFETVSRIDGTVVAEHADISDDSQAVWVPGIGTTALDKETGKHKAAATTSATVVDTIAYKGLEPGVEYTAKGKLIDKATGKPARGGDGKDVTAEVAFKPEKREGEVQVSFTVKGVVLSGKTFVAFESVYDEKGNLMASHEDKNDEAQTVSYHAPGIGDAFDKAGDFLLRWWWLIGAVGLAIAACVLLDRFSENDPYFSDSAENAAKS